MNIIYRFLEALTIIYALVIVAGLFIGLLLGFVYTLPWSIGILFCWWLAQKIPRGQ